MTMQAIVTYGIGFRQLSYLAISVGGDCLIVFFQDSPTGPRRTME